MSSTAVATLITCPPPTTNTLDSQQRARLIRSTRKLGALLGTTPYLLEGDLPVTVLPIGRNKLKKHTPRALKRQGSIFSHNQTQSLSLTSLDSLSSTSLCTLDSGSASLVSNPRDLTSSRQNAEISSSVKSSGLSRGHGRRSVEKPRPLCLRLNTVPVSPTDTRFTSLPPSPISRTPVSDFPPTPCTPNFSTPDPVDIRRKRMAKLARHLGENIPPELVPAKPHRTRSMSVSAPTPSDTPFALMPQVPLLVRNDQDWVGQWNRSDIREVQKELRNLKGR
ncbi:hypothetical protein J3A83DRAFT_4249277 [Scleroderma citrinum]